MWLYLNIYEPLIVLINYAKNKAFFDAFMLHNSGRFKIENSNFNSSRNVITLSDINRT